MKRGDGPEYQYFPFDLNKIIEEIGEESLLAELGKMLLIRNFEIRAEAAYQQGKVGGFFHSYSGQEAIQTSCVLAFGQNHWYTTSYRCHALALLLGSAPDKIMAELYGKEAGNAKGRGGSMHLYAPRLLGGFGIVGGHLPIATGAGFTIKYKKKKNEVSLCFLGDGAVVQGAAHEAWNLASLWDLPCLYVIENNQWGMGTAVARAVCVQPIAERKAPGYDMKAYTFDGMNFFSCYAGFKYVCQQILHEQRPIMVEVITERFKGHSVSDPGLYRSKEELHEAMLKDPIIYMKNVLIESGMLNEETFKRMDKEKREVVLESMRFAEESPFPDPIQLEEGVMAP